MSKIAAMQTTRSVTVALNDVVKVKGGKEEFCTNLITTSRYNPLTFLPVNLFMQFQRAANLYFLFIGGLQLIPNLSPTDWRTTIGPLILVLAINACKEIFDDYYRHKSDGEVNSRLVERLRKSGAEGIPWRDVKVGDILRIKRGSEFPADLILLSASTEDGIAYVETANLDGETNLKVKASIAPTRSAKGIEGLSMLEGTHLECELPNNHLYKFEGAWVGLSGDDGRSEIGVSVDSVLLRGSTLRNVDWVLGAVIFTGKDSKLMRNMLTAPSKISQLERHMNTLVIFVFTLQIVLAMLLSIGRQIWYSELNNHDEHYYLRKTGVWPDIDSGVGAVFTQFLTYTILLNQMIPLSLYVTLEMVKMIQCIFLNMDRKMFHAETDSRCVVRTTTLNEELGQVEYVLSDKTGTLTQNVMAFVHCSIAGINYKGDKSFNSVHSIAGDKELQNAMRVSGPEGDAVRAFWDLLSVCHTVVPADDDNGGLIYQASSPDEEALVTAASLVGRRLTNNVNGSVSVEINGETESWEILAINEFSSTRKRMSVVVRDPRTGNTRLLLKGADNVVLERLSPDQPSSVLEAAKRHMEEYSRCGLRTLVVASRDIPPQEYSAWAEAYHNASVALHEREERMAEAAEMIERNCILVGASAVEDKLQDGVPEAIAILKTAGIRMWVLTGDKLETAVAIANSCNLLQEKQPLLVIQEKDVKSDCLAHLQQVLADANADGGVNCDFGLVIEGGALTFALQPANQDAFLQLCHLCRSVVCCRVSPLQKALVTTLVKDRVGAITLGIGDGANDVGMIKAAHIGVGISGREGRAAVLASDFSFGQFRYLTRLLLVHGRWSYKRNKEVVMYAFYKNIAYVFANIYFSFYSAYSAQVVYSTALVATFNVLWTSFPTIIVACFDQDVKAETVETHPQLYVETQKETRKSFFRSLSGWCALALWHSVACYFPSLYVMSNADKHGMVAGLNAIGTMCFTCVVMVVNFKLALRTYHWTWLNFCIVLTTIIVWYPFIVLLGKLWLGSFKMFSDFSGVDTMILPSAQFWLLNLLVSLGALVPDFAIDALKRWFKPDDFQIMQEMEQGWKDGSRANEPRTQEAGSVIPAKLEPVRRPTVRRPSVVEMMKNEHRLPGDHMTL